MRMYEIDNAIPSLPPSSRELYRRRREIHDAANVWLWHRDVGPYLGRDDSIIYDDDEVYVVDHEGIIDRHGNLEDAFLSPIQRIGEGNVSSTLPNLSIRPSWSTTYTSS